MLKLLLKFWPALTPLILFALWYLFVERKRQKEREEVSKVWLYALAASVVIAFVWALYLGLIADHEEGNYVPAQFIDGELIPGYIESR